MELNRKVWNTARATEKVVEYEQKGDLRPTLGQLRKEGYVLVGLEITDSSTAIASIALKKEQKIALVIGAERHGINEAVRKALDFCCHVEMYGQNSSMNVVQATSIALYTLTNKLQNVQF